MDISDSSDSSESRESSNNTDQQIYLKKNIYIHIQK